jgi:hypothetical protein
MLLILKLSNIIKIGISFGHDSQQLQEQDGMESIKGISLK